MKNRFLIIMIFFGLHASMAWGQIDDDLEYDNFKINPSDIGAAGDAIVNRYRLGDGIRFTTLNNSYGITFTGYLQTNLVLHNFPTDDNIYDRWRVRRARFRMQGYAMGNKIRYRLGIDMVKGSETDEDIGSLLSDAWIQYRPFDNNKFVITVGQRGNPSDNRELMMSSYSLQFNERSKLSSLFGTTREIGIFTESTLKIGKESYLRPSFALTDGDGPISIGRRYGGLKAGARVNYLPFGLFRISGETRQGDMVYELAPKLSIGVAYSYNSGTSDRRGGRENGAILYRNDLGNYDLPDYGKLVADFLFKYRGWSFLGEFAKSWAYVPTTISTRVRNDGSTTTNFEIDGVQHIENYIRNRMVLGTAFNIQGGYMFRNFWSVDARYTYLKPDTYSYMNNDLYYKRNNIYEISASKYLSKSYAVKIQGTFGLIQTDGVVRKFNDELYDGWEKHFNIMLQLAF